MSKKPKWKLSPPREKRPHFSKIPLGDKSVRVVENPESTESKTIVWHVKLVDHEGPFGWCGMAGKREMMRYIHDKLGNFETMTWAEIKANKQNHQCPVAETSQEAQKRLREINLDQYDELFSLRLSGKERIWGIREQRVFRILWWDPKHQVYPSYKKYT
jgi:hypothetical protein